MVDATAALVVAALFSVLNCLCFTCQIRSFRRMNHRLNTIEDNLQMPNRSRNYTESYASAPFFQSIYPQQQEKKVLLGKNWLDLPGTSFVELLEKPENRKGEALGI